MSLAYGRRRFVVNAAWVVLAAVLGLADVPRAAADVRILALGDSLTAGYGLSKGQGFTDQLERALRERGIQATVINAGVSGDTSAGGRARINWALADNPQVAIVELGANDGMRGLNPQATRANLAAILDRLAHAKVPVLLTGMLAPPNLGRAYGEEFKAVFAELAVERGVAFYPFFLEGVAARPDLNQDDGIHPNAEGVAVIVRNILPAVIALIEGAG